MKIKLVDINRQTKVLEKDLSKAIKDVIDTGDFIMGKKLQEFEASFAKFCKKKYAIGLNSGTDALLLGLLAYGVGRGDEVITVANGYFSDAMVVSAIGAKPVFVDIDPLTYTMDTQKLQEAITKRTKAIIPVHIYGQAAEIDEIYRIAKKHNITVIEDACQAHGGKYKGRVLPYGQTGAFSFYPGKNLGCFGDGGALVTDNKSIAEKLHMLRNDGSLEKYRHTMIGYKSRLDAMQAAILSVKLPYLNIWNEKRRHHAGKYSRLLKKIPQISFPQEGNNRLHVYHLYVIETKNRDALRKFLARHGVETVIHYPTPIHLQKPYVKLGYKKGDFPIAEQKAKKILSLPMFAELKDEEIIYICKLIEQFFNS